jgi:hypothetical protein
MMRKILSESKAKATLTLYAANRKGLLLGGLLPFAMALGYHLTLVKDATAAVTRNMMRPAHELSRQTFAHAISTTEERLAGLAVV